MNMKISFITEKEIPAFLDIAGQVEPLFGPMLDDENFHKALEEAVKIKAVLGCHISSKAGDKLLGALVLSREENSVEWLAIDGLSRGFGAGRLLLSEAIKLLDERKDIKVQTFSPEIEEGKAAVRLYESFGFRYKSDMGNNPAGIPTVLMVRNGQESN